MSSEDREREVQTQREDGYMKTEAEIGTRQLHVKGCQLTLGRTRKDFS